MTAPRHPYVCTARLPKHKRKSKRTQCGKRATFPKGTLDGAEQCPRCNNYSMTLDRYRMKCRREGGGKDHPERCDCHGAKRREQGKIQNVRGVTTVFGPHRKGRLGCVFNEFYGPGEAPEDYLGLDENVSSTERVPF